MTINLQIQKSLGELVYLDLKHKIMTGKINTHTRLKELDLVEEMNVSRTPIRKAIRKLATDGLVVIEPRRGAYVSDISTKRMMDLFEVREDLEGLAAYLASQRITDEEKRVLSKIHLQYEEAVANRNKSEIVEFDEKFHNQIVSCSRNKNLIRMVNQIQELSLRFRYLYYDDLNAFDRISEEHKGIMDAIISGDADKARQATDRHIQELKQFISNPQNIQ